MEERGGHDLCVCSTRVCVWITDQGLPVGREGIFGGKQEEKVVYTRRRMQKLREERSIGSVGRLKRK